jgi:hypothetical protein
MSGYTRARDVARSAANIQPVATMQPANGRGPLARPYDALEAVLAMPICLLMMPYIIPRCSWFDNLIRSSVAGERCHGDDTERAALACTLPADGPVLLTLHDSRGSLVRVLADVDARAGAYTCTKPLALGRCTAPNVQTDQLPDALTPRCG